MIRRSRKHALRQKSGSDARRSISPQRYRARFERLEGRRLLSVSGDFNGDGFDDLAVGANGVDSGTGAVHIIYGSNSKLTTTGNQLWQLDSPGINGHAQTSSSFGETIAVGDFDGDGFDDLAVGSPNGSVDGKTGAGYVNIIYGSSSGLRATGDQQFHLGTSGVDGVVKQDTFFGAALAAGDFDNDGRDDLAIGAWVEDIGSLENSGAVHVLYGRFNGLSADGDQRWTYNSDGINGVAAAHDFFGVALAVGDFNGDQRDDLAIGANGRTVSGVNSAGAVSVIYGSKSGLTGSGDQLWRQSFDGLFGTPHFQERFGFTLAAGDFDGDSFDDLAAAAPDEDLAMVESVGEVLILYGSNQKLTTTGQQLMTGQSLGIATSSNQRFGVALATGDFDNNGRDELAVGMTGFDIGAAMNCGLVAVVRSSAAGLTVSSPLYFTQDTVGIPDVPETGDFFGYRLTTGDYNGDNRADLVIGVALEDHSGFMNTGAIHVLYGSALILQAGGNHFFTQDTIGILGSTAAHNEFGLGLA